MVPIVTCCNAYKTQGAAPVYILNNLERRKDKLKTQLVWIGAQKEPLVTARTWRWVDGEYFQAPQLLRLAFEPRLFIDYSQNRFFPFSRFIGNVHGNQVGETTS